MLLLLQLVACSAGSVKIGDTSSETSDDLGDTGAVDTGPVDTGATDSGSVDTGDDSDTQDSADPDDSGTPSDCFASGVLLDASLSLDGGVTLDGYDGGPYGSSATRLARVSVNGTAACAASVSSALGADLWTGGDPATVLCLGYGGSVSGATSALSAPLALPTERVPLMPDSSGALSLGWGASQTLSADATYDSAQLENGSTLTVSGARTLWIDGDLSVAGTVSLTPGATLDIYVSGGARLEWGTLLNAGGHPSAVTLHMLGTDDLTLAYGSSAAMRVVHPDGRVNLEGGALVGTVAAGSLRAAWGSTLHVDMSGVCAR